MAHEQQWQFGLLACFLFNHGLQVIEQLVEIAQPARAARPAPVPTLIVSRRASSNRRQVARQRVKTSAVLPHAVQQKQFCPRAGSHPYVGSAAAASSDLQGPFFDPNPVFNPAHPNFLSPAGHHYTRTPDQRLG
jgi:hypothetical protein